jgi:hypothetical protein
MSVAQVLVGKPSALTQLTPVLTGQATIVAGQSEVGVGLSVVKPSSIIVCWSNGTDTTARVFGIDGLVEGVGFNIVANANATADTIVKYAILAL